MVSYGSDFFEFLTQLLKEALAVFRTIRAVLFIFPDVTPDHPVSQGQADVDGPSGLGGQLFVRLPNRRN